MKQKRVLWILILFILIFLVLIIRIGMIQFVEGSVLGHNLKEEAYKSQTLSQIITPKRGIIYDATGNKILAMSASVETITISPTRIENEDKEKVALAFSEIFELNYDEVLAKVKSENSIQTIAKKVDKEKTDELRKWMTTNKLYSGINIDEDSKRFYPYNNLASNLIGFCGVDGEGRDGIEYYFDDILKGNVGKIVTATNAVGQVIPIGEEQYVKAQNGSDIVLSIDAHIQTIVEENLKAACKENECLNGGNIIIMDPKTGDVLAMATYPDYNLNTPSIPVAEEIIEGFDKLNEDEQIDALIRMWRNRAISDGYEPGSTFKVLDAAIALEEGVFTADNVGDLDCEGFEEVEDWHINCWRYLNPHGELSLRTALMNSCNPGFIQTGSAIGVDRMCRYLKAFGIMDRTGIELPGEYGGLFFDKEDIGPVELATLSMGQRFELTPLQLVTAISALGNDGVLMKPRVVKQVINSETKAVQNIEPTKVRQVVSKETANLVLDMMRSGVDDGIAYRGAVAGYSVAGKTGTAEMGTADERYTASFVGIAPVSSPKVTILVSLYDPTGDSGFQGGALAAPVASNILAQILPYLENM